MLEAVLIDMVLNSHSMLPIAFAEAASVFQSAQHRAATHSVFLSITATKRLSEGLFSLRKMCHKSQISPHMKHFMCGLKILYHQFCLMFFPVNRYILAARAVNRQPFFVPLCNFNVNNAPPKVNRSFKSRPV